MPSETTRDESGAAAEPPGMVSSSSHPSESGAAAEVVCNACGFEASFVPEGMIPCERCQAVQYCSVECLKWDWSSGGHSKVCVDTRPAELLLQADTTENSETTAAAAMIADDNTVMSMQVNDVFDTQALSNRSLSSQNNNNNNNNKDSISGPNAHAEEENKKRQIVVEGSSKSSSSSSSPSSSAQHEPASKSPRLSTFLAAEAKKKLPSGIERLDVAPALDDEFEEVEEEESIELELEEVEDTEASEEVLVSIVEESSNSEEPDMEGSWRDREPFQLSERKKSSKPADGLDVVQEHEEEVEEDVANTPARTNLSGSSPTAGPNVPAPFQNDSNSKSSLKDFRAVYTAQQDTDKGNPGDSTAATRRSLKTFRDVYSSGSMDSSKSENVNDVVVVEKPEASTPSPQQQENRMDTTLSVGNANADTADDVDDDVHTPRYLRYRNSLSRSAQSSITKTHEPQQHVMATIPLENNSTSSSDQLTPLKQDYVDRVASKAAESFAVVKAAAVVGQQQQQQQDTTEVNGVHVGGSSSGEPSTPRYLRYRNSLAQSGTPSRESVRGSQTNEGGAAAATTTTTASVISESDGDNDDEIPSNPAGTATAATLALGGAAAAAAAGGVGTAAALGAMNSTESAGEATPQKVTSAGGADETASSMPRYMRYRNSLAQSTGTPTSVESPVATSNEGVSNGIDVLAASPGEQDERDEDQEEQGDNSNLAAGAGVAAAALGVGAATAAAVSAMNTSPKSAGREVGAAASESSMPRYMRYRNSLAQSSQTPKSIQSSDNIEVSSGPTSLDVLAGSPEREESANEEGRDTSKAAAGIGAAAAVLGTGAATAAAAGAMNASKSAGTSAPASESSMPQYMRYRNSLAQSGTPKSTQRGDEGGNLEQDGFDALVDSTEDADKDEKRESGSSMATGVGAAAAVIGVGAATAATVGVMNASDSGGVNARQLGAVESHKIPSESYVDEGEGNSLSASVGANTSAVQFGEADEPTPAIAGENGQLGSSKFAPENKDLEAPPTRPDALQLTSARTLDSLPYKRRRLMKYCFGFIALVALPLGIGLGVSSRNKNRGGSLVDYTESPTSTPLATTESPTPTPFVTTESPTSTPLVTTESPTSAPLATENPTPVPVESTLAPTELRRTQSPTIAPTFVPTVSGNTTETPSGTPVSAPTIEPTQIPTEPPSEAPSFSFITALLNLLSSASFDGGESMAIPGTPQNRAFEWLLSNANVANFSDATAIQRYSLATFYFSTEGSEWTNQVGWLSDEDECTWFSRSSRLPVCDENGIFRNLDLGFNEVSGSIPPELALLSNLNRVALSGGTQRRIGGPLPSELGSLIELRSFDVFGNAINGSLPPEIGNWTYIQDLNLGFNQFSGPLPDSLGQMTSLSQLSCNLNFFTGTIPTTVGRLVNLEKLSLSDNDIAGALPAELGALTLLRELTLDGNGLSSLPSELGGLVSLEMLKINRNDISGSLFTEIGSLSSLRTLEIYSNALSGEIPTEIGLLSSLRTLDLSFNSLIGNIPTELGQLGFLRNLYLQSNNLNGLIPAELGQLSLLTTLRVDGNDLTGRVPSEVCDTFQQTFPKFYLDCAGDPPQIICPPGACCTYCCDDAGACECVYANTDFAFLC